MTGSRFICKFILPVDAETYNEEILLLKLRGYPFVLVDRGEAPGLLRGPVAGAGAFYDSLAYECNRFIESEGSS
ncbi:hypothetical protein SD70_00775 [Gordoniibacillus kamchatkensis]|uniref:Uncharacterized protein n=1 Tax=Gordoniibacillus kamchatkensis TaxID=1590651 RepID=A0ABR5ANC1_9BACL|nr:hypothetical protein SD70_00775 [Paenibacillus sp. VKM B-2647]